MDISVVICSYNRCASLAETLASVNACELPVGQKVEIVLIDNNSTDDTARTCAEFAPVARMPFRHVVETRQGLSFARNRGIEEAAGKAIVFTDDDVLVNDKWLVTYAKEFGENRVDCAYGRVHPDWRDYRPPWFSDALRPAYALLDYGGERLVVNDVAHEFYGANFAVRKELLRELGGFDVRLGRTKGKLFIGEETRVYRDLLRRGCVIVYNPLIEVHHVIEDGRKDQAYLRKYYHDTAESLVYDSLQGSPRHRVLGVPFFRVREFAAFYAMAIPRLAYFALTRKTLRLLTLRLVMRRNNRMLALYLQGRFARSGGNSHD